MTRIAMLRGGYAGLGIAFAALAASVYVGGLLLPGLAIALLAGLLLAFSDDDLPKWGGIALCVYFALGLTLFLAATPITINKGGGYFVNSAPPELAGNILGWLGLASPLALVATAVLACWERELAPRILLFGAFGGYAVWIILSIFLIPHGNASAIDTAQSQANLLNTLFAVSGAAGALGALWASSRADDYA